MPATDTQWEARVDALTEGQPHSDWVADHRAELARLLMASDFADNWLATQPDALILLAVADGTPQERLQAQLVGVDDESSFMRVVRQWRNSEQVRLIWQEVCDQPGLPDRLTNITAVADTAIKAAVDFATQRLSTRFGLPETDPETAAPQQLVVLGMGKLGAGELNLSSDIDLIFAFPEEGATAGEKSLSHSEFFTRVGRKVIQYLDQRTADGIAFRVDMRLRPNGQSGPLAMNFNAMLTYYREQGRDWERYAMIKARPITGAASAAPHLMPDLQDFVFRRYVDYQVLTSLRDMKRLIAGENRRLQRDQNIKLGQGGIREIEFVVQAVQLIQGGQSPALTQPNMFDVLPAIADEGLLPETVCADLLQAYTALRRIEHLLQAQQDKQTQTLPEDPGWRDRLCGVLGFAGWPDFVDNLSRLRGRVSTHFEAFISPAEHEVPKDHLWEPYWLSPSAMDWQADFGDQGQAVCAAVEALREEADKTRVSDLARERMQQFMPLLLAELARLHRPVDAIERVLPVVMAILRRSAYLVMLLENPQSIRELVKLSLLSPWLAGHIQDKPYLLDELTDSDQLYRLPDRRSLSDDIHQRLLRLPDDDLEQQMEQLRHFRHSRVLRAAACELTGNLPLMQISDYLTYTAEEVLQQVFYLAWEQMTEKYGTPTRRDGSLCDTDFAILAYGKMGGMELSYESDLDLVFLHDGSPTGLTQGARQVDNNVFFMRLGQRIIHLLTTQTPSGILYEADMRLRPSGNSGLLVTTLSAFDTYQRDDAWTWEHQALVRARTVAGCPQLRRKVETVRQQILGRPRDPDTLLTRVASMREKMRVNLATPTGRRGEEFHIKQDPGGVVDIEFLVQYLVLRYAPEHHSLARRSDNMRLLEALERYDILTAEGRSALSDAYLVWRQEVHRQTLQQGDGKLHGADTIQRFRPTIDTVHDYWNRVIGR